MTIHADFLLALEHGAEKIAGARTLPWPSPGNPGGFVEFKDYGEWQKVVLGFRLASGIPSNMSDLFDRALKFYLAAWLDFDLIIAGEMAALSALEHSLRDCYLGDLRERHAKKVIARANNEKREPPRKRTSSQQLSKGCRWKWLLPLSAVVSTIDYQECSIGHYHTLWR